MAMCKSSNWEMRGARGIVENCLFLVQLINPVQEARILKYPWQVVQNSKTLLDCNKAFQGSSVRRILKRGGGGQELQKI